LVVANQAGDDRGRVGAVVEIRHLHEILTGAGAAVDLDKPSAVVDHVVALKLYKLTIA
jgi:hypothetical protein